MNIGGILTTATTGMVRDARSVHQSAARIVQHPVKNQTQKPADLATEIVRMKQAEIGYTANATIIRTADDMAATLLNVLA